MAIKLDDLMTALPAQRRARIDGRVMELASLKDFRKAIEVSRKILSAVLDGAPNVISSSKWRWHSYSCVPTTP